MSYPTPTAIIIKKEFDRIRDYRLDAIGVTYEEYIDKPKYEPTPTAVIIKQEFKKVHDYMVEEFMDAMSATYEDYLDTLDEDDKNTTYLLGPVDAANITMLALNWMRYDKGSSQYNPNQFFDPAEEDFNYDYIAKFPYLVRLTLANTYHQSGLYDTFMGDDDLNKIINRAEVENYNRNFKQTMIAQSKIEALLDNNVSAYNCDVITHILQFL